MENNRIEKFAEEISSMIRARYPLIHVTTYEEARCLDLLDTLGKRRDSSLYIWSRTQGIRRGERAIADIVDPMAALKWFEDLNEKAVFALKDFHPYLKEPGIVRKLRDLAQGLKRSQKNIILIAPVLQLPPELAKEMTLLDLPLPSREEIQTLIRKAGAVLKPSPSTEDLNLLEAITDAASGLTYDEIENVLAKSIVARGSLDRKLIQDEKRQIVKRSGLLEFVDTSADEAGVGGLTHLKEWLSNRRGGLSVEARNLKLPVPKGILLVGIPGCGKSLTAMTVGRSWQLPLLRLDMGRIFAGVVGSSESNVRNAIATCEAVSPCVLWIDEIEKGLSGTQSSGSSDGGTTSRVFGTLLTWMQEKKSAVFVVATANDISALPPEFLRKGRFDEIFFVDLPNREEREEIFKIQLERYGWTADDLHLGDLIQKTESFSGAEIEQVLIAARYQAFGSSELFSQKHMLQAISETVPLSKTMGERIEKLRSWAVHRARPASKATGIEAGDRFAIRSHALEREEHSKKAGEI